jgi:serine/threonine protein kinase
MTVTNDRRQKLIVAAGARRTLVHPHLVPARVARDDRGRVRIVLQTQSVPTLSEVLASGPLEVRESLRLLYGVATAADALGSAGLVARDLTPERILVSPRLGGLLADAGMPLELLPRDGSPGDRDSAYRSPEERAGLPIDGRSNVYSLAAVFLSTMTGPDGQHVPLPAPAQAVIRRAMSDDRERRYARCPEFIVTLAASFGLRRQDRRRAVAVPGREARAPAPAPEQQDSQGAEPVASGVAKAPRPDSTQKGSRRSEKPTRQPDGRRQHHRRRRAHASPEPKHQTAPPEGVEARKAEPRSSRPAGPPPGAGSETGPRLPAMPRLRMPEFPRPRMPEIPRPRMPKLPRLRMPEFPRPRMPELPHLRMPEFPHLRMPSAPRLPNIPQFRLPAVARLRRPAHITPTAIGIAAALAACVLVAVLVGRTLSSDDHPSRLASPAFAVALPSDWAEARVVRMGVIDLNSAVAAAPLGERGAGLVVGAVPDMMMLDHRFRADGTRSEVRLGPLRAWKYAGLRPRPGITAIAYLTPTTGDSLLVVCHARPADARAVLPQCEEIASTITLRGERPASLARVSSDQAQLAQVMGTLREARVRGRRRLAETELAERQAGVARELERAYGEAADRLGRAATPEGEIAVTELVDSLRATASAYGELARAADELDEADYRAARRVIDAREAAVERGAADRL